MSPNLPISNNLVVIQVALVEDDVYFQNAIMAAIKASTDMRLASVSSTCAAGLRELDKPPVDVLLVDLGLPDGSGIDVIRAAHAKWPTCAVMVFSTFADEAHVMKSIEAGASGYLLKDGEPGDMLTQIRNLHVGGSPISPLIARQILRRFRVTIHASHRSHTEPAHGALSAREKEVLELVTKGYTAAEIAKLTEVSFHTVQTYVRRIYKKLEVTSKAEAIYEARSQNILGN